ncbi:MAG: acetyl-CoA carboxylase biotin carboxyl carrier protein [Phycisphaerales bacterium]|nr:acetyl-CoA carboxylase biotin carboxyl carrier protein [Phycisphaerales bacterium]
MIDIRKLKELVRLMVENDLAELDLRDQQETVTIKRGGQGQPLVVAPISAAAAPARGAAGGEEEAEVGGGAADEAGLFAIESPMVGTFYSAPNPDTEAFVSVGKSISPDSVVCLVEAMKVFNEIKAECTGVVERVLVSNGDAVEFGQKLFLVRPA